MIIFQNFVYPVIFVDVNRVKAAVNSVPGLPLAFLRGFYYSATKNALPA